MNSGSTGSRRARFDVGDRVRVKDLPNLFYTRTQMYVRGVSGTVAARTYEDLIPEDEAWNRDDAEHEQFYIVRFRQKDLWEGYPFENDTLQTEFPDRWLESVSD
jgi:thiocyanate hydrolase subunit beta